MMYLAKQLRQQRETFVSSTALLMTSSSELEEMLNVITRNVALGGGVRGVTVMVNKLVK